MLSFVVPLIENQLKLMCTNKVIKFFSVGLGLIAYSGSSASEDESNDEKSDTVSDDTEVILKVNLIIRYKFR